MTTALMPASLSHRRRRSRRSGDTMIRVGSRAVPASAIDGFALDPMSARLARRLVRPLALVTMLAAAWQAGVALGGL